MILQVLVQGDVALAKGMEWGEIGIDRLRNYWGDREGIGRMRWI